MTQNRSYRELLKNIFNSRKSKNPAYSLFSFSQDAGFKSYHMSDILNGRHPISIKRAELVAKNLKMSDILSDEFLSLVTIEHSKDKENIELAIQKLQKQTSGAELSISDDTFSPVSEWYFLAILEIFRNDKNRFLTHTDLAERLNLHTVIVKEAMEKLVTHELLKYSDEHGYKSQQEYVAVRTTKSASSPIRKFHKQIITKSIASIDEVDTQYRHIQSFVALLDKNEYSHLNKEIAQFVKSKIEQIQETKSDGKVYAISFQVFPLENPDSFGTKSMPQDLKNSEPHTNTV